MSAAIGSLTDRLDGALALVTAASNDLRGGCVVGFHTQCSIEPVRYALWLSKANHTYRVALFADHVVVHFLDVGDHDLAALFGGTSGDDVDKFDRCDWEPGPGGAPFLTGCPNRVVLRRVSLWDDGSDHVCLVGEVEDVRVVADFAPLRLSAASDIEAGHAAQDRPLPDDVSANGEPSTEHPPIDLASLDRATRDGLEDIAAGSGHQIDLSPPDAT
ncbi:MAG: flavin reductase [Ilumatobacteraceae bacterium]|nr:flavin reductase [Ilumatobacteraceae bacterium]